MLRYKTNEPFQKIKKPFPLFLILGVEFKVNSFIQPVHTHTQKKQHFLYKKKKQHINEKRKLYRKLWQSAMYNGREHQKTV